MKYKYLIASFGLMACMTSCSFTDLSPKDSLTDKSYWRKVEDLKLYANNLYTMFPGPDGKSDGQSDDVLTSSPNSILFDEAVEPTSGGGWDWGNIRACNYFLNRYQTVEGTEAEINRYVAEVRFFRALDYFSKVKSFGDVPWYESDLQTNDKDLLYKARDSRDFIIGKIIEDLEFAIQWLPVTNSNDPGRLSKYVAYAQLSRVCLYEGTYKKYRNLTTTPAWNDLLKKAANAAFSVMDSKQFDIVKGSDEGCGQKPFEGYPLYYGNQFIQDNLVGNKECILARIYVQNIVTQGISRDYGKQGYGYSKDFAEAFLFNDGKPLAAHPEYNDATLEDELKDRDPRMYQIINNKHRPTEINSTGVSVWPLPNIDPSQGITGYNFTKYLSPIPVQNSANASTIDWFLYRYAEVLLNYAEAKAELDECDQTVLDATINLLRNRVGMPHLTINPTVDNTINYGYAITPLLYEIRRERRVELASEGFRWSDIVRWKAGKLFENPKTFVGMTVTDDSKALFPAGSFNNREISINGKNYLRIYSKELNDVGRKWSDDDKRYLSPLPLDQLTLNKNLKQNPGWKE